MSRTAVSTKKSKAVDGYEYVTGYEERFLSEIKEMEEQSYWLHDMTTKDIRLIPAEYPVYAEQFCDDYGLDYEDVFDTMQPEGTRQLVDDGNGHVWCLAETGIRAVSDRAKLFGSSLGRMEPEPFAVCLNHAFKVAKDGATLGYVVSDRLASMHAESVYEIMPISDLFQAAKEQLEQDFGYARFLTGVNRLGMTVCEWELPDMKEALVKSYKQALKETGISTNFEVDQLTPVVRFQTSNTSNSSAFLFTMFRTKGGSYIRLVDPIGVKHEKSAACTGMELFRREAEGMYPKFFESSEKIKELAETTIYHGPNCVVNICKKFGIPRKYGEEARTLIEAYTNGGTDPVSAHDVYLAISEAVGKARFGKAGMTIVLSMEDTVARMLRADWSEFDLGGVATWGK